MFFAVFHTGLLIVLGFGGSGLEDSSVQLALGTVTVLTSLWTVFFLDDCMQDLFAVVKICPAGLKILRPATSVGVSQKSLSVPFGL